MAKLPACMVDVGTQEGMIITAIESLIEQPQFDDNPYTYPANSMDSSIPPLESAMKSTERARANRTRK